jgi:hypothetical protein
VAEPRRVKEAGLHETAVVSVVPVTHLLGREALTHILTVDQADLSIVPHATLVDSSRSHCLLLYHADVRQTCLGFEPGLPRA